MGPTMSIIFVLIPTIVIVATTTPILKYLLKTLRAKNERQNSLARCPYCVQYSRCLLLVHFSTFGLPHLQIFLAESQTDWFHLKFFRLTGLIVIINIMSNFVIYIMTAKSFRKFLQLKIRNALRSFRRYSRNTANNCAGKNRVKTIKKVITVIMVILIFISVLEQG